MDVVLCKALLEIGQLLTVYPPETDRERRIYSIVNEALAQIERKAIALVEARTAMNRQINEEMMRHY